MPAKPCLGPDGRGCPDNVLVRGVGVTRCANCQRVWTANRKGEGLTGHVGRHVPTRLRAQVIEEQGGRCARCMVSQIELKARTPRAFLEVHHLDGDSSHNVRRNLEALCPNCHHEAERAKTA